MLVFTGMTRTGGDLQSTNSEALGLKPRVVQWFCPREVTSWRLDCNSKSWNC